jgi:hypothetical protein
MVVLMTDMDDNMKKSYPVDLRGAAVKILDYQVGNASDDARKTSWQRYLAEHGASGVEFLHIDDPLTGGV